MGNRVFSRARWIGLAAIGLIACDVAFAQAEPLLRRKFQIASQDGTVALTEFGRQAGQQVLFAERDVSGVKLNAVRGSFVPSQALRMMLAGTGLHARARGELVVIVPDGGDAAPQSLNDGGGTVGAGTEATRRATDGGGTSIDAPMLVGPRTELEEIVVTARKRTESLLKVPQSITAVSANALRDFDVRSVYELQNMTANFSFEKPSGRRSDRPVIRGQSNLAADSNASFYVDGVYVVGSISSTSMDALERIEVLRGPQAAMFGRASFAGAINYVTKQPSDTFEGAVNMRLGDHDDYKASAWFRGPLVADRLQFFLAANWDAYGGQYRNHDPGTPVDAAFLSAPTRADSSKLGNEETRDVVGKLRWLIGDAFQVNAKVSRIETDDGHMATVNVTGAEVNCYRPVAGTPTARSRGYYCGKVTVGSRVPAFNLPDFEDGITSRTLGAAAPAEPGLRRKVWRNVLDAQFDHAGWHYLAQVAQDDDKTESVTDFDLSLRRPLSGALQILSHDDRTSRSVELRATSPATARLRGLVGVYGYRSEIGASSRTFASSPILLTEFSRRRNENRAAFGQLQYDVTPALELTVEARVASDEKEVFGSASRPARETFKSFTPRASVAYKFNDALMVYAIVATGNKPGDFNASAYSRTLANDATFASLLAQGLDRVKEEKQKTYELGVKGTLFDGRMAGSADVFYIDWTNQALVRNVDVINAFGTPGVAGVLVNAGKSHVVGAELELSARPWEHLTLSLAYGIAHAVLDKYNDDEITITTGVTDPLLINGGNAKGRSLPFAPDQTAGASATWRQPVTATLEAFASTNLRYESRKYDSATNYQFIGDLLLWNWRVGVETSHWNVATYFNNVLDDRTPTATIRGSDFTVAPFPGGSPRSFQLGLRRGFEFGLSSQFRF
jgi:iron complex outermembrane receptor protein